MSRWTHISGVITVEPLGRTQHEKRYILETVLDHLPSVTGSEGNMQCHVVRKSGYNEYVGSDEFGNIYKDDSGHFKSLRIQREYMIVVEGNLRDRDFSRTYREFQKYICRLAKRVYVDDILVMITGRDKYAIVKNFDEKTGNRDIYGHMWEYPSWSRGNPDAPFGEPNWSEYLMWDHAKGSEFPMALNYKYFSDPENDDEMIRRARYLYGDLGLSKKSKEKNRLTERKIEYMNDSKREYRATFAGNKNAMQALEETIEFLGDAIDENDIRKPDGSVPEDDWLPAAFEPEAGVSEYDVRCTSNGWLENADKDIAERYGIPNGADTAEWMALEGSESDTKNICQAICDMAGLSCTLAVYDRNDGEFKPIISLEPQKEPVLDFRDMLVETDCLGDWYEDD